MLCTYTLDTPAAPRLGAVLKRSAVCAHLGSHAGFGVPHRASITESLISMS